MSTRVEEAVWTAATATDTKELRSEFSACPSVIIEIVTVGFSGTLDIQGRQSAASDYANILYFALNSTTVPVNSVAQLSYTLSTATARYVVPEWWVQRQLVMTRSAGSITVNIVGLTESSFFRSILTGTGFNPLWVAQSLVDDEIYAFPVATHGCAMIVFGDGEASILMTWTSAGVPTEVIQGNPLEIVQLANTDTYYCVYDAGTYVAVRNRKGSTKSVLIFGGYAS